MTPADIEHQIQIVQSNMYAFGEQLKELVALRRGMAAATPPEATTPTDTQ